MHVSPLIDTIVDVAEHIPFHSSAIDPWRTSNVIVPQRLWAAYQMLESDTIVGSNLKNATQCALVNGFGYSNIDISDFQKGFSLLPNIVKNLTDIYGWTPLALGPLDYMMAMSQNASTSYYVSVHVDITLIF